MHLFHENPYLGMCPQCKNRKPIELRVEEDVVEESGKFHCISEFYCPEGHFITTEDKVVGDTSGD